MARRASAFSRQAVASWGKLGGGGLAQQGGDDAPDACQLVADGGAWVVAVGASWGWPALLVLLVTSVPVLAAGVLAGAGALAGAVGGLLAGPRAVVSRLSEVGFVSLKLTENGPLSH